MTQTVIHGSNVNCLVKINDIWTYIGCATGCVFEFLNEIILKTNRNAGLFRKKRARISDSRSSVSGVMTSGANTEKASIFYFLQEGVRRRELEFQFLYIDEAQNDISVLQTAIVQDIQLAADVSNFAEFDMQLEGTGNITVGTVLPPSPTDCPVILSDWWVTTPDATSITGASANGIATTLAGKTVIEVDREGLQQNETSGTPGNRQYRYTGTNLLETDINSPYLPDETIFVIWTEP